MRLSLFILASGGRAAYMETRPSRHTFKVSLSMKLSFAYYNSSKSWTTFQTPPNLSIAMAEPAAAPMQRNGGDNNSATKKKKKEMVDLKAQLEKLRLETAGLEHQLAVLSKQDEQEHYSTEDATTNSNSVSSSNDFCSQPPAAWVAGAGGHTLTASQIQRYSRQLLLPSFGVEAQERLAKGSVLVVGAGGLGSPVAMYLAAGGVGRLGIMDPDCVEVHNLHRQLIHNESSIGEAKVESAKRACLAINSSLEVCAYPYGLAANNALEIIPGYDVVVDASDNVATRYLISDACVVSKKPLVSGAALGMEGQLTVYNYLQGPCYRCLFPVPPPQAACQRCSDAGVLGVVPGIIGTLQALEAIKILSKVGEPLSSRMLILDALSTRTHTVKLRGKSSQCVVCGECPKIDHVTLPSFDYEGFTLSPLSDAAPLRQQVVGKDKSVTCREYKQVRESQNAHVLLDVRDKHEFAIASLPNSLNIPYTQLSQQTDSFCKAVKSDLGKEVPVYVICRRGNDSQRAVDVLRSVGFTSIYDITGGLQSWVQEVDPQFPAL